MTSLESLGYRWYFRSHWPHFTLGFSVWTDWSFSLSVGPFALTRCECFGWRDGGAS
jgi:hypothetical protein